MTDVEESEILHMWHVCDVENVANYEKIYCILCRFVAKSVIHDVLSRNFMWRKIEPKSTFLEEK